MTVCSLRAKALLVVIHADRFEIQILDVRLASHRDQQLVDRLVVAAAMRLDGQANAALVLDLQVIAAAKQLDAIACASYSSAIVRDELATRRKAYRERSRVDAPHTGFARAQAPAMPGTA